MENSATADPILRRALGATAVMNLSGSAAFLPFAEPLRAAFGLPPAHAMWTLTVGIFIFSMGLGYARLAWTGREERVFVGVAAIGKALFASVLLSMTFAGELPWSAAAAGVPDFAFAALFAWRLAATRDGGR